jgi:hypothetical protein
MAPQSFCWTSAGSSVSLSFYTDGRTPWMSDRPVSRPLPIHRTAQTEQTHRDIHALSGIRTYDPSVRVSETSSCLRTGGHCDQQSKSTVLKYKSHVLHAVKVSTDIHQANPSMSHRFVKETTTSSLASKSEVLVFVRRPDLTRDPPSFIKHNSRHGRKPVAHRQLRPPSRGLVSVASV